LGKTFATLDVAEKWYTTKCLAILTYHLDKNFPDFIELLK